jgi:oxygen-independent coproporphyrinogen-3 oxidase
VSDVPTLPASKAAERPRSEAKPGEVRAPASEAAARSRPQASELFGLDLEHAERILPRYAGEGPRYTSYPTAPVWSEAYGAAQLREELGRRDVGPAEGLSLYVHVPFCESLCHFCACNKVVTRNRELALGYLDAIEREVAAMREALAAPRPATQLHWGGGTPTYLSPEQIRRLYRTLADAFPLAPGAELGIEVDPRVTTEAHVEALRECGFNRLSMGVQDFDPRVQAAVHRIQPVAQTGALVERARASGFASVNFDLIYGLPHQTEETFAATLDAVIGLAPDRIALYSYAHVTWLAKQQRGFERKDLPPAPVKLRIFLGAIRRFLEAGYRFIGLDHFALPEDELCRALEEKTLRRNFMGHTTQAGVDLLGFGPSAISEVRGSYAQSERQLAAWEGAVRARGLATMRGHRPTADDRERRFVIERILCHAELRASEFAREFGRPFAEAYAQELASLGEAARDGLVAIEADGSLRVMPLGRLLVRNLAMAFDAYLPTQRGAGRPMFSKTV